MGLLDRAATDEMTCSANSGVVNLDFALNAGFPEREAGIVSIACDKLLWIDENRDFMSLNFPIGNMPRPALAGLVLNDLSGAKQNPFIKNHSTNVQFDRRKHR